MKQQQELTALEALLFAISSTKAASLSSITTTATTIAHYTQIDQPSNWDYQRKTQLRWHLIVQAASACQMLN